MANDDFLYLQEDVIEACVRWVSQALRVRPVVGPLKLKQHCDLVSFASGECWRVAGDFRQCGDATIPSEHFAAQRYCPDGRGCQISPGGEGVANADFLLYVTAHDDSVCSSGGVRAYANACAHDQQDRPIAGFLNFCKSQVLGSKSWSEDVATAMHEMLHALGFSSTAFAFFRDDTGAPRTPRDASGQPEWSSTLTNYVPHPSSVLSVQQTDGARRHYVMLPRVVAAAQAYYGCSTLTRVPLEEQGGDGSAFSHWEARYMYSEIMAPVVSDFPRVSSLTLALLEDSGWYKPDYSQVGPFHFGKGRGCGFLTDECVVNSHTSFPDTFCTEAEASFCTSGYLLGTVGCTHDLAGKGLCDTCVHSAALPPKFQHFADARLGGSREYMGYCPIVSSFVGSSWCRERPTGPDQVGEESYGAASRCVLSTIVQEGFMPFQDAKGRCYDVRCEASSLRIRVGDAWVECKDSEAGARKNPGVAGWAGHVVCPSHAIACGGADDAGPGPMPCLFPGVLRHGRCICAPGYLHEDCSVEDRFRRRGDYPFGLRYPQSELTLVSGTPVSQTSGLLRWPFRPALASGPAALSFGISPALPSGLVFSTMDGSISGSPARGAATARYVVRAEGGSGAATTALLLTVLCSAAEAGCEVEAPPTMAAPTAPPEPSPCVGGWRAPSSCGPWFVFEGRNISGCAADASGGAWCAHLSPSAGAWSRCERCGSEAVVAGDSCINSPPLWTDNQGHQCADYMRQRWCTPSGEQGAMWDSKWGGFADYAVDGIAADQACCACGGGARVACADDPPGWADSDDSPCAEYRDRWWCTASGAPGVGWRPEWGAIGDYAEGGVSAKAACCACGGGARRNGTGAAAPAPAPAPPGAVCVESPPGWVDREGHTCGSYSRKRWCADDGGLGEGWPSSRGAFEEHAGANASGACCACGGGSWPADCANSPPQWVDAHGRTCEDYSAENWCNATGRGPGWPAAWGPLAAYATNGVGADVACCACGGGRDPADTSWAATTPSPRGGAGAAGVVVKIQSTTFASLQASPGLVAFTASLGDTVSAAAGLEASVKSVYPSDFGHVVAELCIPASCAATDAAAVDRLVSQLADPSSPIWATRVGMEYFSGAQLFLSRGGSLTKLWPDVAPSEQSSESADSASRMSVESWLPEWLLHPNSMEDYLNVAAVAVFALAIICFISVVFRLVRRKGPAQAQRRSVVGTQPLPVVVGAVIPPAHGHVAGGATNTVIGGVAAGPPPIPQARTPDEAMNVMLDRGYGFEEARQALQQTENWDVELASAILESAKRQPCRQLAS